MVEARKVANKIADEREKRNRLPRQYFTNAGTDSLPHR